MKNNDIAKLFFKESNKYIGWTDNWGNTKGLDDFKDICIILNNKTYEHYIADNLLQLTSSTLNKLYVAFTRAKGDVYLIPQKKLNGKYKKLDL